MQLKYNIQDLEHFVKRERASQHLEVRKNIVLSSPRLNEASDRRKRPLNPHGNSLPAAALGWAAGKPLSDRNCTGSSCEAPASPAAHRRGPPRADFPSPQPAAAPPRPSTALGIAKRGAATAPLETASLSSGATRARREGRREPLPRAAAGSYLLREVAREVGGGWRRGAPAGGGGQGAGRAEEQERQEEAQHRREQQRPPAAPPLYSGPAPPARGLPRAGPAGSGGRRDPAEGAAPDVRPEQAVLCHSPPKGRGYLRTWRGGH